MERVVAYGTRLIQRFRTRLRVRNGFSRVCKTVENTSLKLSVLVSAAFRSCLNDPIQCFLIKYNAQTVEYYFPGFPGIGKKSGDKNTGQNDTGSRDRTPNRDVASTCLSRRPRTEIVRSLPEVVVRTRITFVPLSCVMSWCYSFALNKFCGLL